MDYTGMICDGCREPFEEGDDIVVCPECGTPQHRHCYEKDNHCVNEYLHSSDFAWSQPQKQQAASEQSSSPETEETASAPVQPQLLHPTTPQQMETVFMRGVLYDPKDDIGGATVGEAADYIQSGVPKYISRLMKLKNKKLSWNWAAFFFTPYWFFYRKLYKAGAFFLALSISLTLAVSPSMQRLQTQMQPIVDKYNESVSGSAEVTEEQIDEATQQLTTQMKKLVDENYLTAVLVLLTNLVPNIIAAILANYLLKRKMLKVVELAHSESSNLNAVKYSIMRKGGVSMVMTILAIVVDTYLPTLLLNLAYNLK